MKKIFSITNRESRDRKYYTNISILGLKLSFRNYKLENRILRQDKYYKYEFIHNALEERKDYTYNPIKNRVCYCINYSLPQTLCGYTTRSHSMAKAIQAAGFDLITITKPGYPYDKVEDKSSVLDKEEYDGVTYCHQKLQIEEDYANTIYGICVDTWVSTLLEYKPQYVIAASNNENALPVLIACRKLGIPFYYEVRGLWELTNIANNPGNEKKLEHLVEKYYEAFLCKEADAVFTLTTPLIEELVSRGCDRAKFHLVPNCVDIESFQTLQRDEELSKKYNISPETVTIGYAGTIQHYEGLDDLIKACALLDQKNIDFRLIIVGGNAHHSKENYQKDLANLAKDLKILDKIIFTGPVKPAEVPRYYSLMDITPFGRKPFKVCEVVSPIKPVEALAMGKTVIVSDLDALKEMIIDNETGLYFEKGNVESYANALEKAIKNPDLRTMLGENAREWVKTNRQWSQNGETIRRVLNGESND